MLAALEANVVKLASDSKVSLVLWVLKVQRVIAETMAFLAALVLRDLLDLKVPKVKLEDLVSRAHLVLAALSV